MDDAHARILTMAQAVFASEKKIRPQSEETIEIHSDRCDELWAELEAQVEGLSTQPPAPMKTTKELEREVKRETLSRIQKALPDMISEALQR